ncbi:hypothetical protein Lal_00039760 [Lupinus albus]|nr:hypothetical protein Lal_00039760 [Lupinus albus]
MHWSTDVYQLANLHIYFFLISIILNLKTQGSGIPKYKTTEIPSIFLKKKEDLDEYRGEKEFEPKYEIKIDLFLSFLRKCIFFPNLLT